MQKPKKLLPLWVAFGILLVVGGIVFGLEMLQSHVRQEDAKPILVPLEDGIWKLHPTREPERIYEWQGEEHFVVGSEVFMAIFDNDAILFCNANEEEATLLASDQPIDYALGPVGVQIEMHSRKRNVFDIYYLVRDSQSWKAVDWCDQRIMTCTRARVTIWGEVTTQEVFHDPQQPLAQSLHDGIYRVATREDGQRCIIVNSAYADPQQKSPWFFAARDGEYELEIGTNSFTIHRTVGEAHVSERYSILSSTELSEPIVYTDEWNAKLLKYPHLFVSTTTSWHPDFFCRTPWGSLYFCTWAERVDLFPGISREQFERSRVFGECLMIPTDNGTQLYVSFAYGVWTRFDLAVGME